MKKINCFLAAAAALLLLSCGEDETKGKGVIKVPSSSSRFDYMAEDLPAPGAEEVYKPSLKSTSYRPVMVDYAGGNAPVPASRWTAAKTRVLSYVSGYEKEVTTQMQYRQMTNRYGSNTQLPQQETTGRFYVKQIDGRWWIVDPEGYLHYERGVTSLRKGSSARNAAAWNERFGTDEEWMATTQKELAELGFHGTGAFCTDTYSVVQAHNDANSAAPMTLAPSFGFLGRFRTQAGLQYPGGDALNEAALVIADHGSKTWEQFCMEYVAEALAPYKNDRNVLGIFSDNELAFASASGNLLRRLVDLNNSDYGCLYAKAFMAEKGASTVTDALASEFAGRIAEKYYKGVKDAMAAFDPGMMYLGTRLHGRPKQVEGVVRAAGKYCDIVSINYYGPWSVELETWVKNWETWANAPFMVTEFYTKGIEDSDLNNESGAGLCVRNQAARAYAYQHFTLGLLEAKNCVGWHWFKYQDDDGADNSNAPANKGVYDNHYQVYPYLGKFMRDLNYNVYSLVEWFDSKQH
jgi:hypothetical protein